MNRAKLFGGASLIAIALTLSVPALADQDVTLDQDVDGNSSVDSGQKRTNDVSAGMSNNANGISHTQQNNGTNNAIGLESDVAAGLIDSDQNVDFDQSVTNNAAEENSIFLRQRENFINGSHVGSNGRHAVQQNNGDSNAIGASFAVTDGFSDAGGTIHDQNIDMDQVVEDNSLDHDDLNGGDLDRVNEVNGGSFNGSSGAFSVQQNNGNGNAIGNAQIIAHSGAANNTVQDVEMDGMVQDNWTPGNIWDLESERLNDIDDAYKNFGGISTTQQNNGDANVLGVASAVVASTSNSDVDQRVDVEGHVGSNEGPTVTEGQRDNNITTGAFDGSEGILSTQQNNGSTNVIQSGTAVAANSGQGDVSQDVSVSGSVYEFFSSDDDSERFNTINGSVNSVDGLLSMQQNNGDSNVMGIGHAVAAYQEGNRGSEDDVDQYVSVTGTSNAHETFDDNDPGGSNGIDGERINSVSGSFNNNFGAGSIQQNNGNANVMGSAIAAKLDLGSTFGPGGPLGADEDVDVQVVSTEGTVEENQNFDTAFSGPPPEYDRRNVINPSFNGAQGVYTVQQNNGNNNVIGSAVAVSANIASDDEIENVMDAVASVDASVRYNENVDGDVGFSGTNLRNDVTSSFQGSQGVFTVQQNNGNNNAIGSSTGVAANVETSLQTLENVANGTDVHADVIGNEAFSDAVSDRHNNVSGGTFNNALGVVTMQQNNGSNNAVSAAKSIAAAVDDGTFSTASTVTNLSAVVSGNTSVIQPTAGFPGRLNTAHASMNGFQGIYTLQQNNGDNNAVQSAITVTANVSGLNLVP